MPGIQASTSDATKVVALLARRFDFMDAAARIKPERAAVRDEWRKADVKAKVDAAAAAAGVERARRGRFARGRCVASAKRGPRCTRFTPAGTITRTLPAGTSTVVLSARIGSRALAVGKHRLRLSVGDAKGRLTVADIHLTISN